MTSKQCHKGHQGDGCFHVDCINSNLLVVVFSLHFECGLWKVSKCREDSPMFLRTAYEFILISKYLFSDLLSKLGAWGPWERVKGDRKEREQKKNV